MVHASFFSEATLIEIGVYVKVSSANACTIWNNYKDLHKNLLQKCKNWVVNMDNDGKCHIYLDQ